MLVSRIRRDPQLKKEKQMADAGDPSLGRREFVRGAVSGVALAAAPAMVLATPHGSADKAAVLAQIPRMHAENIKRLQDWIAPGLPSRITNRPWVCSIGFMTRAGWTRRCCSPPNPPSTSRDWWRATPVLAARPCYPTERSQKSTCAWCPAGNLPQARSRATAVAEIAGLVARIHFYRRALEPAGRTLRAGTWHGSACAR
jgi:hypothetical protein